MLMCSSKGYFVVVTSRQGANRVYVLGGSDVVFSSQAVSTDLVDTAGRRWHQSEGALTREDSDVVLPRYVAQRAFWFGWYAQYPNSVVIGR